MYGEPGKDAENAGEKSLGGLSDLGQDEGGARQKPFYFIIAFWGKKHRNYFLELCLPSLLAPNNAPALEKNEQSRIVIVTTKWDWWVIQRHPTFALMKNYIKAYPILISRPWFWQKKKMLVMSMCQRLAAEKAHRDGAVGVFLAPDVILSDGFVRTLQRLVKEGWKVALCAVVRFSSEGCLPEIKELCGMRPGEPITLSSRELIDIGLRNLHSETLRYQWDSPFFSSNPITCMFEGPQNEGVLVHTFSWAPILVDYSALGSHDTSTFEEWTLDGDYIHRNFENEKKIYIVTDSDELVLSSYTSEEELHYALKSDPLLKGHRENLTKIRLLRRLFHDSTMDSLKREIFSIPVYWHRKSMEEDWEPVRQRAENLITEAVSEKPTKDDEVLYHYIQRVQADDISFLRKIIHLDYNGLYRLFIRRPIVLHGRKPIVYFYVCFRFLLKPLAVRLKESEVGFKFVCALRGWEDDVVPPGYLSKKQTRIKKIQ